MPLQRLQVCNLALQLRACASSSMSHGVKLKRTSIETIGEVPTAPFVTWHAILCKFPSIALGVLAAALWLHTMGAYKTTGPIPALLNHKAILSFKS